MATLYRLLTGTDDAAFCHKISKALNEGWELYGPPSISYDSEAKRPICAQAVTKQAAAEYDPEKPLSDQ